MGNIIKDLEMLNTNQHYHLEVMNTNKNCPYNPCNKHPNCPKCNNKTATFNPFNFKNITLFPQFLIGIFKASKASVFIYRK